MSDPSKYSTYSHIRAIKEVYNKCMHLQNVVPAIVIQNNRYRYSFIKEISKKAYSKRHNIVMQATIN